MLFVCRLNHCRVCQPIKVKGTLKWLLLQNRISSFVSQRRNVHCYNTIRKGIHIIFNILKNVKSYFSLQVTFVTYSTHLLALHDLNRVKLLRSPSMLCSPSPVVCYIGLCACKCSAKANIPVFPPEGVSLSHTPPLPVTPPLDSFVYFRNIMTSLLALALLLASATTHCM